MKEFIITVGITLMIIVAIILAVVGYYLFILIGLPIGIFLLVHYIRKLELDKL